MPRRYHVLYLVRNLLDGKRYVGKTSGPNTADAVAKRWRKHLADARSGKGYLLHRAIRKYGEQHFSVGSIGTFKTERAAFLAEIDCIARISPQYNIKQGGQGGKVSGTYVRVKLRASEIARKAASDAGQKLYSTGRPCKAGHIAPRFASSRQCTECHRLRYLASIGGTYKGYRQPKSEAFKIKVSETMKGKPKTLETRLRMSMAAKAREAARRQSQEDHHV